MRLAIRCAKDSIPPLRVEILLDIALHPGVQLREIRTNVGKPRNTVRRELEALTMLGLLSCEEKEDGTDNDGKKKYKWLYSIAEGFDIETLRAIADRVPTVYENFAAQARRGNVISIQPVKSVATKKTTGSGRRKHRATGGKRGRPEGGIAAIARKHGAKPDSVRARLRRERG